MPSKFLTKYLSQYCGLGDWHLPAFRIIKTKFAPNKVLYPGSWIHLTPSLVFLQVVYVDLSSKISSAFSNSDLVEFIKDHSEYQHEPEVQFHSADYRTDFGEVENSFDLLISLNSGFVSQACGKYLKTGGILFTNNQHYDASMAFSNSQFRLLGVFQTPEKYVESKESITSYFITTKGVPITLEMVNDNSQRAPSKARHKLGKKASFYIFQKR